MPKRQTSVVVGSPDNFWVWSPDSGWDLTHPPHPTAPAIRPRLSVNCEISNVVIDPQKTALLIIYMQNLSMSTALNDETVPAVLEAEAMLLKNAIPAARKAKIQIKWLSWGLTVEELKSLMPAARRNFGWRANYDGDDYGIFADPAAIDGTKIVNRGGEIPAGRHPGADLGQVQLAGGTRVDAGRELMRGAWNTDLHTQLLSAFQEGQTAPRPDILIYKNRNSGLYDSSCECTQYLGRSNIQTLLFAGMNTDQCVMGTLQDAHSRGFDTILLRDFCATSSPHYAQMSAERNCCRAWGFLSSSGAFAKAVDTLE
jgi:nicotinamidase-related amidase